MVDDELRELARQEGLKCLAVMDARSAPEKEEEVFRQWLSQGRHGTMKWMERHAEMRYRPQGLLPGCRSMIFVGFNYYQPLPRAPDKPAGRVARYAWGRDYHKELGKRLRRVVRALQGRYPHHHFRSWTDATPLAERYYAELAGLGFSGRNNLIIHRRFGSWFFLGEILSTLKFREHRPSRDCSSSATATRTRTCPDRCSRCIDSCPTRALMEPHRIDASRCISYLTIEYQGVIGPDLARSLGDWVFGCDLCQERCPFNQGVPSTGIEGFLQHRGGSFLLLRDLLSLREEDMLARFAGSPLMRAGRTRLVRNACIAAANSGALDLLPQLRVLREDADEIIAAQAEQAITALEGY
ncbi:epoxyqueuosine reductase [Alkalispirochaeta americana]|uniref:Epoxyqueuosine reductase n=1 Tax=Alkalispirochaeta americana TaxID=159291 RepID=A0A1N6QRR6_9SPIO|nr:tRNA epoxyqueuosine(34) reductase QueG [Alkalispirochaeta americana]SIQ19340.1 epoxyqueuosine reductase [Alkalispirochaeta americana]